MAEPEQEKDQKIADAEEKNPEVQNSLSNTVSQPKEPRMQAHHAAFFAEMEIACDPDNFPELWR